MKTLILFILLLLPSLCFAGQGMGPGPGISRVNVELNSFDSDISPWTSTNWGIRSPGLNGIGSYAGASLSGGGVSYGMSRTVTISRVGATAKFYYFTNFEGNFGNEGYCVINANGSSISFNDLSGYWSSQQTLPLPVGTYDITVTMGGYIGKWTYCGIDEFEIYY